MSGWCHRKISDYPQSNHNSYKTTYAMAFGYPKLNALSGTGKMVGAGQVVGPGRFKFQQGRACCR